MYPRKLPVHSVAKCYRECWTLGNGCIALTLHVEEHTHTEIVSVKFSKCQLFRAQGPIRDSHRGSAALETTLDAEEKLPYDALLGHVTNLLSEVRTALRQ